MAHKGGYFIIFLGVSVKLGNDRLKPRGLVRNDMHNNIKQQQQQC